MWPQPDPRLTREWPHLLLRHTSGPARSVASTQFNIDASPILRRWQHFFGCCTLNCYRVCVRQAMNNDTRGRCWLICSFANAFWSNGAICMFMTSLLWAAASFCVKLLGDGLTIFQVCLFLQWLCPGVFVWHLLGRHVQNYRCCSFPTAQPCNASSVVAVLLMRR